MRPSLVDLFMALTRKPERLATLRPVKAWLFQIAFALSDGLQQVVPRRPYKSMPSAKRARCDYCD